MRRYLGMTMVSAITIAALAGAAIGDSHADKAAQAAIKARQAQMQLQAYNLGILGEMAKGTIAYDATVAAAAATNLNLLANFDQTMTWPDGTMQGFAEETRAAPEIWSDAAGFADEWAKLAVATEAMKAAAGTDLAALQASIGAVGASCGSCHKAYRGPEN
jgi:cytochrome c556